MTREYSPEWQEIVRQLTVRRILLRYSQRKATQLSGLTQASVSDFELGKRVFSTESLLALAAAYGLRVVFAPKESN
jgi:transcriptional regulator with XRE-family HTH domain